MAEELDALAALSRCIISNRPRELCEVCGTRTGGPSTCERCTGAAARVLARAYLDSVSLDHWDGADEEWGHAETLAAATRMLPNKTVAADPALVARLCQQARF